MKTGVGMTTAGFAWLYPLRFAGDGGNPMGIAPTRGAGCFLIGSGVISPSPSSSPIKGEEPQRPHYGGNEVQQDAAGVWGVPRFSIRPP